MGIKGLTAVLKQSGVLPTFSEETGELFSSLPKHHLEPGSTLAIDGPGFAFHIYRLAYFQHYKSVMSQRDSGIYKDDFHLIMHLLPTMLHLKDIQSTTQQLLHLLMQRHGLHLHIFLDGHKQPRKMHTRHQRRDKRTMEESALRNLFKNQILPASFKSRSRGRSNIVIPDAYSIMREFPVPTLLFEEIYQTFRIAIAQQHITISQEELEHFHDMDMAASLKLTECDGEADQAVAMASALDVTNQTFAVGQDSDYLVFGFPSHHHLWDTGGDLHVQYLPLDSIVVNEAEVTGYVITRKHLAEEFHLEEDLIIEATILVGNDYTASFVLDQKLRKRVNFFRDHWTATGRHSLTFATVMEHVSDLGDYQVESDDEEQQLSIEFSRALFQLEDVSNWLEEEEDDGHEHGSEEGSVSSTDDGSDEEEDDVVMNYVKALDQTLMQQSEADFEERSVCIKSQIMAPFEQTLSDDPELEQLLRETLDVMMCPESLGYDSRTIPPGLSWNDYMLAEFFQRSILATLRRRSADTEGLEVDRVPSKIFDHSCFYHALAARNRSMAEIDDPEPTITSKTSSECESKHVRKTLPIDEHKDDILRSIENNRVTIIQGETGCGKSSRVPVMLLEAPPPEPSSRKVKIFICQPRRIAAKSLTERVRATEPHLKDSIALRMGHGIREHETKHTKAWFVTTGYLVRYLANNAEAFHDVTHLVIDEVHERSIDSDIICLLAKRLLQTHPTIRLVLMSATVAAKLYQDYFGVSQPPIFVGVRCHPIQEYFSEDIGKRLKLGPKGKKSLSDITEKCLKSRCLAAPNAHYILKLQHMAVQIAVEVGKLGSSVLIFVPGMADIVAISEMFEEMVSPINYTIIPIHSDIPFEDQMTAFDLTESDEVKVIVATNAAESSITLPDVDNVICFGLCKSITYNKQSHRQVLETSWISKANATQRAGRTGRVRPGNVFRLYPKEAFDKFFRPFEEGEILRCPLDSIILNLRTIVEGESVAELLKECIEPPDLVNIQNSFTNLHRKNFITEATDEFAITSLGELVVALGIDLSIAALVGFGIRLGLLRETVELAAVLSFPKSPWLLPNPLLQEPEVYNEIMSKTYLSKAKFDGNLFSETFSIMNVLFDYERCNNRHAFCKKHGLSYARISRLASTRDNLRQRVASYLGKDSSSLVLRKSPRDMEPSKIIALRILKTWMFYDGIVKLSPTKHASIKNDSYTMQLKGDQVDEMHLDQVLDRARHNFTLKSEGYMIFNGAFAPVEMDYHPAALVPVEFEERLLSFSIERGCNFIVSKIGRTTNLYICHGKTDSVSNLIDGVYTFEGAIKCTVKNARSSGDCGIWSAQYTEASSYESNTFMKYEITETLNMAKKTLKRLRDFVRSQALASGLNTLIFDIGKATGGPLNVYSFGINDFDISKSDFVQLFRTPEVKVQKSPQSSLRQSILFEESLENGIDQNIVTKNIPEGARMLLALASGRRSNQVIRFKNTDNKEIEYLEVILGKRYDRNRWKWTETGETAILDSDSIPATIDSQPNDMYACSGNILELNGGRVRAEGITMLPGGEAFVNLAKECIGISSLSNYCDELEEHGFAAEAFYEYFVQTVAGADLRYFPVAVELLCNVFDSLEGLDMNPWLENDPHEESSVHADPCGDDRDLGAEICKSLGDANVPSSFMTLFSGQSKSCSKTQNGRDYSTEKQLPRDGKYKCISCSDGPFKWGKLLSHVASRHNISPKKMKDRKQWLIDSIGSSAIVIQAKPRPKTKPQYKCKICQAKPFKWKAMKSHAASNHDIVPSDMKNEEWRAKAEVNGTVTLPSTHDDNGSSVLTVQRKAKTKTKPQYKCKICQAEPFKWKTMKSHAASNHDIVPSDMKNDEWLVSRYVNEVKAEGTDKKKSWKARFKCIECNAGPFRWEKLTMHAQRFHEIELSSGNMSAWLIDKMIAKPDTTKALSNKATATESQE